MRVLSVGEILWDLFPTGELLGGAPLNVCVHLQRMGDFALLLTAVGNDERGDRARQEMMRLGLSTELAQVTDERPTGVAEVSFDERGEPRFAIPRPAAFDYVRLPAGQLDQLRRTNFEWLYFGTLLQREPKVEWLIRELIDALPGIRCFYDMNLRTGHWNLPLVERLCRRTNVLKLNENEARTLHVATGGAGGSFRLEDFCSWWASNYGVEIICVTRGADGCFLHTKDGTHYSKGFNVTVQDTVGAGDGFAAAFLHGLHHSWPVQKTLAFANALGALITSRAGATPEWTMSECIALASSDEVGKRFSSDFSR
jgi:fructokinase